MTKIPVAILGATGMVGQRFIEKLSFHPWFEIVAITASSSSVGKKLKELVHFQNTQVIDPKVMEMTVCPSSPDFEGKIAFSALDSSIAAPIEKAFQEKGFFVISNTKCHRMVENVPLVIPEVNLDHLNLLSYQKEKGKIITNPNCSTIGLCIALKPLIDAFGIEKVQITTMQAISGAGYPGVASWDILDNVIPYIQDEELKLQTEPLKILGSLEDSKIQSSSIKISAHCNRVAVQDGHTACLSIQLKNKASIEEMKSCYQAFRPLEQYGFLPSAPKNPIIIHEEENAPQPKFHRHLENGMAVSIGRIRPCPLFDYKMTILSHNTIRGAAGSTVLIGELLHKNGLI
ncbi:MAG: aspartate-semialdehyde dehydrogenase [Chlamydiae bacterium]|jgi:aspartate-semialdehyde dehydrogenase|nr:aspartate-semialdehyde dehydrogenase [Chlamydiota bacterium]